MKLTPYLSISKILFSFLFGFFLVFAQSAWAAQVNVAGSTQDAAALVAANGGGVVHGDASDVLQGFTMRPVALANTELLKALTANGSLQALFSELCPFTDNNWKWRIEKNKAKNAEILKQIAQAYVQVQKTLYADLVVDVIAVIVKGEKGPTSQISLPFASFIATELQKNGVKNVRLNHQPLSGDKLGNDTKNPAKAPA